MSPPRSVFAKSLHDHRRGTWWWIGGIAAFLALEIALYPSIRSRPDIAEIWADMPDAVKAMFGISDGRDLTSGTGFLEAEVFGFMLPLALVAFAIVLGGRAIGREEERGTLDLLLSLPLRRGRLVAAKALAASALTLTLALTALAVLAAGTAAVDMGVPGARLAAAVAAIGGLALLFGSIALLVTCASGAGAGRAYGVAAAGAATAFLVHGLARVADVLEPVAAASPFRWALGGEPLRSGFRLWMLAPYLLSVLVVLAAAKLFERRDLR